MAEVELSDQQRYCMRLVYDLFHSNGVWPLIAELEHSEFRKRSGIEVREALSSIPRALGAVGSENRFFLRPRGIYEAMGEVQEIEDFIRLLRLCVERYEESPVGHVTAKQLLEEGLDAGRVNRAFRLAQFEDRIWVQLSGSTANDWNLQVNPEVRHFADVTDIRGYIETGARLEPPAPPPRPSVVVQPAAEVMQLSPQFRSREFVMHDDQAFVLMPFAETWSDAVWVAVQQGVARAGMRALRADQMRGPVITEDIWRGIVESRLVIADVTGRNPNVYYELGVVHTIGKDFVLISQDDPHQMPFDIYHFRQVRYNASPEGLERLTAQLPPAILYFVGDRGADDSARGRIRSGSRGDSEFADAPHLLWSSVRAIRDGGSYRVIVLCNNAGKTAQVLPQYTWVRSIVDVLGPPIPGTRPVQAEVTKREERMEFDGFDTSGQIQPSSGPGPFDLVMRCAEPDPIPGERAVTWRVTYMDDDMSRGYITECSARIAFAGLGTPQVMRIPSLDNTSRRQRNDDYNQFMTDKKAPSTGPRRQFNLGRR